MLASDSECKYVAYMQSDSTLQRLARTVLDEDPTEWVKDLRSEGNSWQSIATEFGDAIGAPVSRETIRLWVVNSAEAKS